MDLEKGYLSMLDHVLTQLMPLVSANPQMSH